ncbi:carotenoid oxygenase family protein [Corynebacterium lubricantis]|uniref:carotenoid oxygenase family protein n=1 Tax=Corynebacterium lubricantis TaxID=541095 RepID=UPI000370821C|nr:carotenoid oxygenase family protein [Corynebacterium lubricantis]
MQFDTNNKFLNGPFEPWHEETEQFDLEIIGEVPQELNGALFRTGSNPKYKPRHVDRYHWFEGDGMVYAVYLRDGKAAYKNKWVNTDALKVEVEAGEAIYSGFVNGGTIPALPEGAPQMKNVPNTNVGIQGDRLLVFFEGGLPHQMHPESLETHGTYDFNGDVPFTCTAHYKVDPDTGNMLFYSYQGTLVTWYEADSHGQIVDTHAFNVKAPSMFHDFAISENYAIFFVTPALFLGENVAKGNPGLIWDEAATEGGVEIVTMHRKTHEVKVFRVEDAFFPTHFFNAYEEGTKLVIEAPRIERFGTPIEQTNNPLSSHEWFKNAIPWRWEVDFATGTVRDTVTSNIAGEFPMINPKNLGRKHNFGYFVTTRGVAEDTMSDGLAKNDLNRETVTVIEGLDDLTNPSEPIFVPREGSDNEDAGYLLSIWWNRATGKSELCIYDTEDFGRTPLARIPLPGRVPFGFHGSWAGRDEIEQSLKVLADEGKN